MVPDALSTCACNMKLSRLRTKGTRHWPEKQVTETLLAANRRQSVKPGGWVEYQDCDGYGAHFLQRAVSTTPGSAGTMTKSTALSRRPATMSIPRSSWSSGSKDACLANIHVRFWHSLRRLAKGSPSCRFSLLFYLLTVGKSNPDSVQTCLCRRPVPDTRPG